MKVKVLGPAKEGADFCIPFFEVGISAGFPSPAEDHTQRELDLHELLVEHPASTFFIRVEGDSMIGAGIHSGDILVVDRSLSPQNGKIVVALINGEFTVKRLKIEEKQLCLAAENPRYNALKVTEEMDFQIWGIVTYVIHRSS